MLWQLFKRNENGCRLTIAERKNGATTANREGTSQKYANSG